MSTATTRIPFHLAFPVRDIAEARAFYGELLGCPEGRSAPEWVDFDFYGHQIVAHLAPDECGHRQFIVVEVVGGVLHHAGSMAVAFAVADL